MSEDLLESLLACSVDDDVAMRVRAIASVRAQSVVLPNVDARARELRAVLGAFRVSVGRLVATKRVDKAIDHAAAQTRFARRGR